MEVEAWGEGEKISFEAISATDYSRAGPMLLDENDSEVQIIQAATLGNVTALRDMLARLAGTADARDRVTRAFLAAINESSDEALGVLLQSGLVDLHSEEQINERNCLHEATISGKKFVLEAALAAEVDVSRMDVYGRIPLHYACMHGRVDMLHRLIARAPETIDRADHDNFTPLIHSIIRHHLASVELLLSQNARIDPTGDSDHVPLNLACQHGSLRIAKLLLERGARILCDAEGLYPQHQIARSGLEPQLLLLLSRHGADLNQKDKLYQWTPLFHAASEGHVNCLQVLLEQRVDVDALDEKDLSAMYYATWEGRLECMRLLSERSQGSGLNRPTVFPSHASAISPVAPLPSSAAPEVMAGGGDGIPDLSLPPPIIPLRRYGHNFLDTKTFVQITFAETDAIKFYNDSRYPAARLTISSKLSDLIPRNVMLPIQDDFRIISFQISDLDSFAVDFEIFPTFGSKVIAKTVALPNVFRAVKSSSGRCDLPLFDPRLRAVGQISFNFQVIKPFHGTPLEITHFATYWKATSALDSSQSGLITGSSLSGDYLQIFIQLTSDGMPVSWPTWKIKHHGVEYPLSRLTSEQYLSIGAQVQNRQAILSQLATVKPDGITDLHKLFTGDRSFFTLRDILATLRTDININIEVVYPSVAEEERMSLSPTLDINTCADTILEEVFSHARAVKEHNPDFMRSVVFTSYNPDICTALNWKQPNCKFLVSYCVSCLHWREGSR